MNTNVKHVQTASYGALVAIVLMWGWNEFVPDHQMPDLVAVAIGSLMSSLFARFMPSSVK